MKKEYSSDVDCEITRYDEVLRIDYMIRGEEAVKTIEIETVDIRATDGIQVTYDLDRGGWIVRQPKSIMVPRKGYEEEVEEWHEVGFFFSWNLEEQS